MYFVRSGAINIPFGSIRTASSGSYIWASVASPANNQNVLILTLNSTAAFPDYDTDRSVGLSLLAFASTNAYSSGSYNHHSGFSLCNVPKTKYAIPQLRTSGETQRISM